MDLAFPPLPPAPAIVRLTDTFAPHRAAMEKNERYPFWKARQERFQEKKAAMLRGMIPLVPAFIMLKQAPLKVSYIGLRDSNTDASSYSFPGSNLGAADPLRWSVFTTMSAAASVNRVEVGTSMALPLGTNVASILIGYNPTGTSGTLSVTMGAVSSRVTIGIYSVIGLLEGTPFQSYMNQFGASPHNITIPVAMGGVLILASRGGNTNAFTISGGAGWVTDVNSSQESEQFRVFGHAAIAADNASYAINQSQSGSTIATTVASWAP